MRASSFLGFRRPLQSTVARLFQRRLLADQRRSRSLSTAHLPAFGDRAIKIATANPTWSPNHEANYVLDYLSRALGVRHRLRFAAFRAELRHSKPAFVAGRCRPNTADERDLCVNADERSLWIKVLSAFLFDRLPLFTANATVVKRLESLVYGRAVRTATLGHPCLAIKPSLHRYSDTTDEHCEIEARPRPGRGSNRPVCQ